MKAYRFKRSRLAVFGALLLPALLLAGCLGEGPVSLEADRVPAAALDYYHLVTPVNAYISADQLEDDELTGLLEIHLFPNGYTAFNWITGPALMVDKTDSITDENGRTLYRCYEFPTMNILKGNLALIFSQNLLESSVYPAYFEGDYPVFIEWEDSLYGYLGGVGVGTLPDFENARRITKTADSFEVEVPMVMADDTVAEYFVFKVVLQNGNWVLDSFPYFA